MRFYPPLRPRPKPAKQVIVYATASKDEADIACSICAVRITIPAELLDVVSASDFICPKCEQESEDDSARN